VRRWRWGWACDADYFSGLSGLPGSILIDLDVDVHWPTAVIAIALALLATGVAWLLRDVLLAAPATAFPLLFTIFVGGAFVIAFAKKRWG